MSVMGGESLTLTGEGFPSDPDDITVKVGEYDCEIYDIENTEITCRVSARTLHIITNDGVDPGAYNNLTNIKKCYCLQFLFKSRM